MVGLFLLNQNQRLMRIVILVLLCLFAACREPEIRNRVNHEEMDSISVLIQSGDIILRAGKDELSQLFKRLNTHNQTYSHCGMALADSSGVSVIHLIGSVNNPSGKIIKEPLMSFVQAESNSSWAIIRYDLDSISKQNFILAIRRFMDKPIVFDHQFDLATDDKMYCSEMLYKALLIAAKDSSLIPLTLTKTGKKYVAIDNLFEHKHCKTIGEIAYK